MIFLSHNSKDKAIVEQVAKPLLQIYGADKVFYDSWSIKPGDSIIDKMNNGIANCEFFLFFISENSLNSEMVKLEWQSALMARANHSITFIPVRISNVNPPHIIAQLLYIDLYRNGLDVAIRQIIDTINGTNSYIINDNFSNVVAYVQQKAREFSIEFRAEYFLEPHPCFLILVENEQQDLLYSAIRQVIVTNGFHKDIVVDGKKCNAIYIGIHEPISPNFPLVVEIKPQTDKPVKILGVMQQVSGNGEFQTIPMKMKS